MLYVVILILVVLFLYASLNPQIYNNKDCYTIYYYNYKGQRKEFIIWKFYFYMWKNFVIILKKRPSLEINVEILLQTGIEI